MKYEIKEHSHFGRRAMAPGGVEHIPLKRYDSGSAPRHRFSTWHYTNLGDMRAKYSREEITLTHIPMDEKYKIGVGHPFGQVWYENKGVIFGEADFWRCENGRYYKN